MSTTAPENGFYVQDPVRTNYYALRFDGPSSPAEGLLRLVWGANGDELDSQYLGENGWVSDGSSIATILSPDGFAHPCTPGEALQVATDLGGDLVYGPPAVPDTKDVEDGDEKRLIGPRKVFNEQLHPRYPTGGPHGGEFMNKPDAIRFLSGLAAQGQLDPAHRRYLSKLRGGGTGSAAERATEQSGAPRLGSVEDLVQQAVPKGLIEEVQRLGLDDDLKHRKKGKLAQKILGRFEDTKQLHTDPKTGAYSAERKKLHDEMIDLFLREKKPVFNGKFVEWVPDPEGEYVASPDKTLASLRRMLAKYEAEAKAKPNDEGAQKIVEAVQDKIDNHRGDKRALYLAGGNASGKSTALYSKDNAGLLRPDSTNVEINFDLIKERMPEFRALAQAHDIYGTDATHFESADIANRLMDEATKRGLNIIVDASGNSSNNTFKNVIKRHHDMGYRTDVLMVDAPIDVAMRDNIGRAMKTGRYVPAPILRRVHRNSIRNHLAWRDADYVDGWQLYRRGGVPVAGAAGPGAAARGPAPSFGELYAHAQIKENQEPVVKVAEGGGGKVNPIDERLYNAVLGKAEGTMGYPAPEGM
jgi:hypothetical protein